MRRYELMLLFRPDLEDDKLQAAVEKVTRAIVNAGGALTKVSPWGKRRMAYDIQHFREASYFLIHFDIAPSAIRDIERGLLISEEILRHLVTVLAERGPATEDEELPPAGTERLETADEADDVGESDDVGEADAMEADEPEADEAVAESGEDEVEPDREGLEPVATARGGASDEES